VKPNRVRFRTGLFAACIAALIATLLVGLAVLLLVSWPPRYRRFISQPLPDGTRYTFLYPSHLQNLRENGPGASPNVTSSVAVSTQNQSLSQWDLLRRRLGLPVTSPAESVHVVVIPLKKRVQNSRTSGRWTKGDIRRHNEHITDARTRTQFSLYHNCPRDAVAQFERHNQIIRRSFRVLPPGDDVPIP
jgi:hypothetical protein